MANEKIHDYVDQVVGGEIRNNNISSISIILFIGLAILSNLFIF